VRVIDFDRHGGHDASGSRCAGARQRLSQEQQQERIRRVTEILAQYRERIAQQEIIAQRHAELLLQQQRIAHHPFQQAYYERLRQQEAQLRDDRYDYETNQYGADALRQALNNGYQAGLQAGRADKQDNWRFDYRQSFAYEDGCYERRQYGDSVNGSDSLLGAILTTILNLQTLD